ncbi:hypothetical protein GCM10011584_00750 [Nocardioides phosphati]|uniref:DUF222 domain-containing protein n=1 Tax=Nocardioides phosphati TaxID=1867775 RepID=A0ABQ2N648_9ACTN|nr:hypothetical protein [Nocardioides phosphati]GGO84068.1 hypothetical protein GCM10011584_00750 [Nocardioides phosphati]
MTQARSEFEYELEDEFEDEAFLGGLAKIAGSLLGEGEEEYELEYEDEYESEDEYEEEYEAEDELEGEFEDELGGRLQSEFEAEDEYEDEYEGEYEDEDEAFLGGLAKIAGSLLGEGEEEYELEDEAEYFFGKIGRFVRRNSGLLKKIAKVAAPLVATAVGGPAAGMLAKAVTSQLEGEGELEAELEAELEEMATAPVSPAVAMGEYLAARAATAQSEAEAEAFIGSAVTVTLSQRQMRELEELLPQLLRGASVLTRILRRNPGTRQAVRFVPGIVNATSRHLAHRIATGQPVGPTEIGAALGGSTRRVLTNPQWTNAVSRRHARGLAHVRRHRVRHHHRGGFGPGRRYSGTGALRPRRIPPTVHRRPQHTRVVGPRGPVGRPRPGFVRVVTPVRVPPRGGKPARVVKVVTDVKVPRGSVPTGRPAARTTSGSAARRR